MTGGAFFTYPEISLLNVKQVEIIRGPGSALYGSNAYSGVVNIVTDTETNQLSLGAGQAQMGKGALQFSKKVGETTLSFYLGAYKDKGDRYEAFVDFSGRSEATRDPVQTDEALFKLKHKGFVVTLGYNDRLYEDFVLAGSIGQDVSMELNSRHLGLDYHWQLNPDLLLNFSGGFMQSESSELVVLAPAPDLQAQMQCTRT